MARKTKFRRGDSVRWIARDQLCTILQIRTGWFSASYKIEYTEGAGRYRVWVQEAQLKGVFE